MVAINHPGTSTFSRRKKHARKLWEPPKDISHAITHMLEVSDCAAQIDPERIYMAGHSLGGTQSFSTDSLGKITAPMLVVGAPMAGSSVEIDLESRALIAGSTSADLRYVEPADFSHFDFMGVCTDRGLAILQDEEPEDAVICEGGTDARRAKHAIITQEVLELFAD